MSLPLCPHLGPQYVLVTYSHNVAFGPLLPFPLLLFLGGMVSHPAETTRLSLCYRSVVCSGSGGGGAGHPPRKPGARPPGGQPPLRLFLLVLLGFPFVFPRGNCAAAMSLISKKFGCLL